MSKVLEPVPAAQRFYCQECSKIVEVKESVYNLHNRRICKLCWPRPQLHGGAK